MELNFKRQNIRKAQPSPFQSGVQAQISGGATQVPPFLHGGLHRGSRHLGPVHDAVHEQVSGAIHVPEFWHEFVRHTAVKLKKKE